MAILQPLIDLVQVCHLHGIRRAVISPGSRSAALTLAFARSPHFTCTVVMDERSAGFIALGMAQQLQQPVVLVCTSGSAAYNFAPAIAEAYFQQVPLLILTADRPPEWIHQHDGQTIFQNELYGKHVKSAYTLPADYTHPDSAWYINRSINEAIHLSTTYPEGPVHINVPIREPFYPDTTETYTPTPSQRVIEKVQLGKSLEGPQWHSLLDEWESMDKILIAIGQGSADADLQKALQTITEELQIPVVGDVTANLARHELSITKHDLFLISQTDDTLRPDLLITAGKSFLSKSLKQYLRAHPPQRHWHIEDSTHLIDTFQTMTSHIPMSAAGFFIKLFEDIDFHRFVQNDESMQEEAYLNHWVSNERKTIRLVRDYLKNITVLNDLSAVDFVLNNFQGPCQLHVGNSMSIRYVNLLGIDSKEVEVFCNRGTSGIDGCLSTAIGAALVTDLTVYLLVGDVAFFYDRNGLLIQNLPENLKIIVLNNRGGVIFRLIDGPAGLPEAETYFETRHAFTGSNTAKDSIMGYWQASTQDELTSVWESFVSASKASILEIQTDPEYNEEVFKGLKSQFKTL
jgi:2-succinyl-5-enolpyruvyl-6-hydroxy-3-cyclohexene-1-carboxylate synthase